MGINLGAGALAVVAAAVVAAAVPVADPGWRFAPVPVAVGGFAALTVDQVALGGVALLGWLVTNGFLENRHGELSWHGTPDLWLMVILVGAAAVGLAAGEGYRQFQDLRARWRTELDRTPVAPDGVEKEGRHG
jgi:hypothetical protein